ncbi:alkaline phosphatase [Bradyrhizobium sp. CCGB20]|uniref:alkaline phosphatase D family protein n=1 Tax=Bradyrhizobium sp. CCGB20 TaxID=2949633 RepID=UPI0020B2EA3B|nr:alkaline phosphatase D family protein [Bradyrhizobium sp. CCGB20]MCP3398844.1 alkaline phosphatase D family protein [Bradyrhizobium sp. CCGB20]
MTGIPRRHFLVGSLAGAAFAAPCGIVRGAPVTLSSDPYTLGIASGCPRVDRVILWTRLAPQPLEDGGMPDTPVEVEWQVAEDEKFARVVARGTERATSEFAHSVHAEARGLQPDRVYWYRFRAGTAVSPVGRTRTAPAGRKARVRFAFASCQQYEQGFFSAYRDMATRDLDLVVHLGDYIYERSWGSRHVRKHGVGIPTTLAEYRNRYALYKTDVDLQGAHAAFPFLSIWDDHEVMDDYANDRSYTVHDSVQFLKIRAAAYQAYYEHMPLPPSARPHGPDATIYEHYRFGDVMDVLLLDDRQYRSASACTNSGRPTWIAPCAERIEEARTMLGRAQEKWFDDRLSDCRARWTIVAQQTLMAQDRRDADDGDHYWMDGWDGYPNARRRLLDALAAHQTRNPIVIGGDRHAFYAGSLKRDFTRPDEPAVATEFVGTSITSDGPGEVSTRKALAENPHLAFASGDKRGYATVELDEKTCRVGFEAVDDVKDIKSSVRRLTTFVVEDGTRGPKAI